MPRRFLIAPDKFKGSLSALQAAEAIAAGIRKREPDAEIELCPIADGGEGFMETLKVAMIGSWVTCPALDPLGRPIDSRYVIANSPDGPVAVIEMAETSGLWRLAPSERDPSRSTTRGTGMQMVDAIRNHHAVRIILGIGGSATNDGGSGMAAALGVEFLDAERNLLDPLPFRLAGVAEIFMGNRIVLPEIIAACDVENPLLGANGATEIFSAQKGATAETKYSLEIALTHLVRISNGFASANIPGAGAAGGLGFGLLHFAGARLVSGFDLVAGLLGLDDRVAKADVVITGEGSLDRQSLLGKGPVALAMLTKKHGKPVVGYCGVADQAVRKSGIFTSLHALADSGQPLETLIRDAGPLLEEMVRDAPLPSKET